MAQVFVFGRVEDDLKLKTSQRDTEYVCFRLRENLSNGLTQQYQVWAWGEDALRLERRRVKSGSLIWLSGSLFLADCTIKRGQAPVKVLKVALADWGYLPTAQQTGSRACAPADREEPPAPPVRVLDGDRDVLP